MTLAGASLQQIPPRPAPPPPKTAGRGDKKQQPSINDGTYSEPNTGEIVEQPDQHYYTSSSLGVSDLQGLPVNIVQIVPCISRRRRDLDDRSFESRTTMVPIELLPFTRQTRKGRAWA